MYCISFSRFLFYNFGSTEEVIWEIACEQATVFMISGAIAPWYCTFNFLDQYKHSLVKLEISERIGFPTKFIAAFKNLKSLFQTLRDLDKTYNKRVQRLI